MTGDSDMKSNIQDDDVYIDVEQYRKLVRNFIDMRRYQTALFWAEKVVNLSQNDPNDVYWEAQCMFLLGEYHRAAHVIRSNGLEKTHLLCYFLALECLYEAKEYEEAVRLLIDTEVDDITSLTVTSKCSNISNPFQSGIDENTKNEVLASINHLKGKIFEAMDNRVRAMDHYVAALQKSVFCTESLDSLVQHEMLMAWEEKELMDHLPFSQQCTEAEAKMIKKLYESKLKKYYNSLKPLSNSQQTPISSFQLPKDLAERIKNNGSANEVKIDKTINSKLFTPMAPNILSPANNPSYSLQSSLSKNNMTSDSNRSSHSIHKIKINLDCPTAISLSNCMSRIQMSVDILASEAEKLFYDCEYTKCLKVLDTLFKKDPYHNKGLTVQVGCLVELKEFNKLFYVAHKLVDRYPDKAISWYAVGCYYDLIGKSDPARRYLSKATSLDRLFGPAWLAFGHSFAKENEHDQAMAAYFKATQLMRGCHLPLLYIGVECGLTKNFELAEKFFYQAMSIAPLDVVVLHELGAIKFEYEYYESAEEVFRTTAEIVTSRARARREAISPRWEPLFNNLGHCCRKNKKYKEALEYHQKALVLKPQNSETYTAIGFVYALMGRLEDAIEAFHKSLSLNRDSSVTLTILNTCIEDLMEEFPMLDDVPPKGPIDAPKIQPKRNNQTEEKPMKYNCVKLKFDDFDASPISDTVDMNCDMSIDM